MFCVDIKMRKCFAIRKENYTSKLSPQVTRQNCLIINEWKIPLYWTLMVT